MKRYIVWFFILVIVIYKAFNIFIHRTPSGKKVNEQKELILYLNKLAARRGISAFNITTAGIKKEDSLSILPVSIEMNEGFNNVINYINDIEKSSLFIMINNISIHKEGKTLKTKLVLEVPVNDIKSYSSTLIKPMSYLPPETALQNLKDPFND